ncbi:MAG: hypothetical protein AAGA03_12735 [Planctomycetota bacterium]
MSQTTPPARRPCETRPWISLASSLVVHATLLLILWLLVHSVSRVHTIRLVATQESDSSAAVPMAVSAEALDPTISETAKPSDSAAVVEQVIPEAWLDSDSSQEAIGSVSPGKVTFFGTEAYGRDFVFVLDISLSMTARGGQRHHRAVDELIRALGELESPQRYHIILFSYDTFQMFHAGRSEFRIAKPGHLADVASWLHRIQLGTGTDPRRALAIAHRMQPDAVFLLSDGDFNLPDRDTYESGWVDGQGRPFAGDVIEGIRKLYQNIPVHAFAYENPFTITAMTEIAEATGGTYRYVSSDSLTPVDRLRFRKSLSVIEQVSGFPDPLSAALTGSPQPNAIAITRASQQAESRRGEFVRRARLRQAEELIRWGEPVFAEYVLRPITSMERPKDQRQLEQLRQILADELGETRLEDFRF